MFNEMKKSITEGVMIDDGTGYDYKTYLRIFNGCIEPLDKYSYDEFIKRYRLHKIFNLDSLK